MAMPLLLDRRLSHGEAMVMLLEGGFVECRYPSGRKYIYRLHEKALQFWGGVSCQWINDDDIDFYDVWQACNPEEEANQVSEIIPQNLAA